MSLLRAAWVNFAESLFDREVVDRLDTHESATNEDPHPQYLKKIQANLFSYAGYGALNLTAPVSSPSLGGPGVYNTLEFDTAGPSRFTLLDLTNNTLEFSQDGVWGVSLNFTLEHNVVNNAGRVFTVRLFDVVDNAVLGAEVPVNVSRNNEFTSFSNANLITILQAQENHAIRVEVGNSPDSITVESWRLANLVVFNVSSWPDPL